MSRGPASLCIRLEIPTEVSVMNMTIEDKSVLGRMGG